MDATTARTRSIPRRREGIDRDRWVSIRPIERSDAAGLSDFYAGLTRESRRRRFLGSGSVPPPRLLATLTQNPEHGLVGILDEQGPNDGAVVAHASVQPDGLGGAEVALAVADGLQGRGLGRALMQMAVAWARELGAARVSATMLADNSRMRRLMQGTGLPILSDRLEAGTEEITLGV